MVIKDWIIDDLPSLVFTLAILVLITIGAEYLRLWRDNFQIRMIQKIQNRLSSSGSSLSSNRGETVMLESSRPLTPTMRRMNESWGSGLSNRDHILLSLTYTLQQTISLILMLVFMTFNLYLCAAVIFGHGVGTGLIALL